jgi:hypothetical protein
MEHLANQEAGFCTIITDVRFENEAEWLRSLPGAKLIYLTVPNLVKDDRYNHESELGISRADTDVVICNDKTLGLDDLYGKIKGSFEE